MRRFIFTAVFLILWANIQAQIETINNPEWGLWQNRKDTVLSFELIQVYGTDFPDESAVFSSANGIWSVDTDKEGNVYVLDNDADMLVKFSPAGKVLWKLDQRGKGPGDLSTPIGLAVSDSLYLSNLIGTRLDLFDKDGQFVKTLNMDHIDMKRYSLLGIIDQKYLVLQTGLIEEIGVQFAILDIEDQYKIVSAFEAIEKVDVEIPAGNNTPPL